ncbi:hypothetical protein ACFPZ0_06280 [Streptomonospora nanhaiensis]|uniref:Uncharacterized protein n=1 Tax=Streptomonospora nanhaiensis TaxID=1323731 RepID=A0A853BIH3_9ACTN|nr:hypothetical protein [Streptomonospora nanhaiensis]MBV2365852.1 hypothetical protein [Streptomonospora nanhaiensis]MBX9387585.1 hypothetical protein [Streptomonospora nanhaiensis]NYI95229.1 hypothetical protein [Streptomonospora nanhaiensis]
MTGDLFGTEPWPPQHGVDGRAAARYAATMELVDRVVGALATRSNSAPPESAEARRAGAALDEWAAVRAGLGPQDGAAVERVRAAALALLRGEAGRP